MLLEMLKSVGKKQHFVKRCDPIKLVTDGGEEMSANLIEAKNLRQERRNGPFLNISSLFWPITLTAPQIAFGAAA